MDEVALTACLKSHRRDVVVFSIRAQHTPQAHEPSRRIQDADSACARRNGRLRAARLPAGFWLWLLSRRTCDR
jgi:hypothetical protein